MSKLSDKLIDIFFSISMSAVPIMLFLLGLYLMMSITFNHWYCYLVLIEFILVEGFVCFVIWISFMDIIDSIKK